uniref:Uncharacterized protein n=1 Tax=Talaromyces marneffei PM1 TaxID=1077442 RepID=A0A093UQ59_TALMA
MPTTPEPTTAPEAAPEAASGGESKPYSTRLNRDDRIRILTLREAGFTYLQIASQLHVTHDQVQYTCQSQQATPKKARGRTPKLSEEDVARVIDWISSSKRTRRMPYYKVIRELDLPIGATALARALKKRGYTRCKALRKPPLSDEHKRDWIQEQYPNDEQLSYDRLREVALKIRRIMNNFIPQQFYKGHNTSPESDWGTPDTLSKDGLRNSESAHYQGQSKELTVSELCDPTSYDQKLPDLDCLGYVRCGHSQDIIPTDGLGREHVGTGNSHQDP